ncbi:MAG: insulinase family protein [Endomicrobium sp.]|nr:insulinase family protein [Endomicrobium sp.]
MESFTLKNGVKVILKKTNGIDVVSMRIFTSVSVISETLDKVGISYLTSKLMTKSTKNRSREIFASDVENTGAELFGYAEYETAGFSTTFLSMHFDEVAEILADVVLNPAFNGKEIDSEKKDIIASIHSRKDSIKSTVFDEFAKLFYRNTPYATSVLGTEKTVLNITKSDLIGWHKYSYNASNILFSVVGNIDKEIVKKSLEKHFSSIPSGIKFEKPIFNIINNELIKKEIKGKFNQAYILVGFPAPNVYDEHFVSIKVINAILGERMTSRLFTQLRIKLGLAYEVNAVYPSRREESYFAIYIGLDEKNIDLALKQIDQILKNICITSVEPHELKNTKAYIKGLYVMGRQTVSNQSYCYGWREIVGQGYEYDDKYLEDVEKITTQNILDAANKIFSNCSLTVIISPGKK